MMGKHSARRIRRRAKQKHRALFRHCLEELLWWSFDDEESEMNEVEYYRSERERVEAETVYWDIQSLGGLMPPGVLAYPNW